MCASEAVGVSPTTRPRAGVRQVVGLARFNSSVCSQRVLSEDKTDYD